MRHLPEFPAAPALRPHAGEAQPPEVLPAARPRVARVVVPTAAVLGCLVAAVFAVLAAGFAPEAAREPALASLLRAMGAIKALIVVAAVALVAWRARHPLSAGFAAAYVVPCWIAAGAAVLIMQLAFVAPAALAFHAAEAAFIVAAWRDRHAVTRALHPEQR